MFQINFTAKPINRKLLRNLKLSFGKRQMVSRNNQVCQNIFSMEKSMTLILPFLSAWFNKFKQSLYFSDFAIDTMFTLN